MKIIFFKQIIFNKLIFSKKSRIAENKSWDKDIELVFIKSPSKNAFNFSDAYKNYWLVLIYYILNVILLCVSPIELPLTNSGLIKINLLIFKDKN